MRSFAGVCDSSNADALFSLSQGPDLQVNAAAADNSEEQLELNARLDLLLRSAFRLANLSRTAHTAAGKAVVDLSVLDVSALEMAGHQAERGDERAEANAVFPLVVSIARALLELVADPTIRLPTLRMLSVLLDHSLYLARACTTQDFDYSSAQVVVLAMSAGIKQLADAGVQVGEAVHASIRALGGEVALKSGFALQQVWSMCLPRAQDTEAAELSRRIASALARLSSKHVTQGKSLLLLDIRHF